jgi:hypothetical protein
MNFKVRMSSKEGMSSKAYTKINHDFQFNSEQLFDFNNHSKYFVIL